MVLSINTSLVGSTDFGLEKKEEDKFGLSPHPLTSVPSSFFDLPLWNRLTQASCRFVRGDAAVIMGSVAMGFLFSSAEDKGQVSS